MKNSEPVPVWTVVKVAYPYTDRPTRERRPALVIANTGQRAAAPLIWVLMITSAENRGWNGDVEISDSMAAGLPAPSIVRAEKIAAVDARDVAPLGTLPRPDRMAVAARLRGLLAAALQQEH